jgi:hypothetical protein
MRQSLETRGRQSGRSKDFQLRPQIPGHACVTLTIGIAKAGRCGHSMARSNSLWTGDAPALVSEAWHLTAFLHRSEERAC